jgi:hypothetical protein
MSIEQYLKEELEGISTIEIEEDEEKMLSLGQTEYFIYQRLTSKKFRKNNLSKESRESIRNKIALSIKDNKPIYLIFAFGGYKNPWVKEFQPQIGWAEVFHIIYILKLLAPIANSYKPGIFLEYESESEASIYHNNISKQDVDLYTESFRALQREVKKYIPDNITLNYLTLPEQYDTTAFFERICGLIDEKTEELRKEHSGDLENVLKRPLFNLKRDGIEDLTKKSDAELNEIALRSLAFNHVFLEEDYVLREQYFNGDERISMVGSYVSKAENPDNWIAINSCSRSNNAFWTSMGVLRKRVDTYDMDIIGPLAFEKEKHHIIFQEIQPIFASLPYLKKIPTVE